MNVVSVSQLNNYVQKVLEQDLNLKNISVRGEISGFKLHTSGHMYFTLKDSEAVIKCAMFRQNSAFLRFRPTDGMAVVAVGNVSIYPRDGQYQLYVSKLENDGEGALYIAFERLKRTLAEEGLFDADNKKPIPKFVRKIAVVTSPTGAVIQDIIRVATRRFPDISIVLYPVKVQGAGAAEEIVRALKAIKSRNDIDVIIVGRGAGSIEDIWAFNEEIVAREIFAARIPIISAVGHETDFTIADFVADMRAPTPSAAAELAVPERAQLLANINEMKNNLMGGIQYRIESANARLKLLSSTRYLKHPELMLNDRIQRVDTLKERMDSLEKFIIANNKNLNQTLKGKLDSLNPMSVLARGYSIITDNQGLITSAGQVHKGKEITIKFKDGEADAIVASQGRV